MVERWDSKSVLYSSMIQQEIFFKFSYFLINLYNLLRLIKLAFLSFSIYIQIKYQHLKKKHYKKRVVVFKKYSPVILLVYFKFVSFITLREGKNNFITSIKRNFRYSIYVWLKNSQDK